MSPFERGCSIGACSTSVVDVTELIALCSLDFRARNVILMTLEDAFRGQSKYAQ